MKKSIFATLNCIVPKKNVLPMHCSANVGANGVTALVLRPLGYGQDDAFGGPGRRLIGDDEHGWSERRDLQF